MVAADSDSAPSRRMPLSCEPCRERKIRCPRKSNRNGGPCDTCVRRGIPSSECVYLRDIIYQRRQQQNSSNSRSSVTDTPNNAELVARIDRLEEILVQAQQQQQTQTLPQMQQDQPSGASLFRGNDNNDCSPTGLPTPVSIHSSNGALRKSDTGYERYEPSFSRWLSVLNANSQPMGLKDDLDLWPNNSEFPFTTVQADVEELLSLLPPLSLCDELKTIYLTVFAPLFHVLHDPTFEQDYCQFRADPSQVSFSWLALLYAILSVAVTAVPDDNGLLGELGRRRHASENMCLLCSRFRAAVMKCLEADRYLWQHNLYTLQALIVLIYGINHTHGPSWALLGTARNIALSIGCHIDPEGFGLAPVQVEERRRCWAGLNMLHTIQNTVLGNIDPVQTYSTTKLPLDINDSQLVLGINIPTSPDNGPTQMSYLLSKFELYALGSRICSSVLIHNQTPSFEVIMSLDAELQAQQESLNVKYLIDTATSPLPDYHAAHLNILFGYSHQLILLLHRPVIMQLHSASENSQPYSPEQISASRDKCLESSRALLGIHRMLYENEGYRLYAWYNRGLGSFHAFHAAVFLTYVCGTATDLEVPMVQLLRRDLQDTLEIFQRMERSGLSNICQRTTPILKKLLQLCDSSAVPGLSAVNPAPFHRQQSGAPSIPRFTSDSQSLLTPQSFEVLMDNMEPQRWLSPSMVNWTEWNEIVQ